MRRRSDNLKKLKTGRAYGPEDLEWQIIIDTQIAITDLPDIELEVNKKSKRKLRAEARNQMISPVSSIVSDRDLRQLRYGINDRGDSGEDEDIDEDEPIGRAADAMFNERVVDDDVDLEEVAG